MARHQTGVVHHVGTFLLFAGFILLLVTTISAPVVRDIPIMKVMLTNYTEIRYSSVVFGTFGHCILDVPPISTDQDYCFPATIGYQPASIMAAVEGTIFTTAAADTTSALTRVMVLHPVACALAFISFILAFSAGFCGSLFAALVSAVAWIVTVIVMACDFALFGIVKSAVNSDGTGSNAYYSTGMWTILAAMLALFFGTLLVFFSCCSARLHRRDPVKTDGGYANGGHANGGMTRRRNWPWRARY